MPSRLAFFSKSDFSHRFLKLNDMIKVKKYFIPFGFRLKYHHATQLQWSCTVAGTACSIKRQKPRRYIPPGSFDDLRVVIKYNCSHVKLNNKLDNSKITHLVFRKVQKYFLNNELRNITVLYRLFTKISNIFEFFICDSASIDKI